MKTLFIAIGLIIFISSLALAGDFTSATTLNLNLAEAELNSDAVQVKFSVRCSYKKKVFDIIQGKFRITTKSCGELEKAIAIQENGDLTLPGVPRFNQRKGDEFENYSVYLSMTYNNQHLLEIAHGGKEQITEFYKKNLKITFKKFELKDFEVFKDGVNLIDHADFMGEETPVTVEFSVDRSNEETFSDCNFKRYHRAYLRPLNQLNGGNPQNNGKIYLGPNFFPFFNDEKLNAILSVSTKDKEGHWFKNTVTLPFTPDSLLNIKRIELQ